MGISAFAVDPHWADMTEANYIECGAFSPQNELYVFAEFDTVKSIAKWSKMGWQKPMPRGTWKSVSAMAVDKHGDLFASGQTDSGASFITNGIAVWKNSGWRPISLNRGGYVVSLQSDKDGNVYASGSFDTIEGVPAGSIAKWDGKSWTSLGTVYGYGSEISVRFIDDQNAVYFISSYHTTSSVLYKWTGKLAKITDSVLAYVDAFSVAANGDLYMAGYKSYFNGPLLFYKYSNNTWQNIPGHFVYTTSSTSGESLSDILPDSTGGFIALGRFYADGGGQQTPECPSITWNGSVWTRNPAVSDYHYFDKDYIIPPMDHFLRDHSGHTYGIGRFIYKREGKRWLQCGMPGVSQGKFAADGKGTLFIGGMNRVSSWDGFVRSSLGDTLPGDISHIVLNGKSELYVGGYAWRTDAPFVSKWSGTEWKEISFKNERGPIVGMALSRDDSLYIVNNRYTWKQVDTGFVWVRSGGYTKDGTSGSEYYAISRGLAFDKENRLYQSNPNSISIKTDTGWALSPDSLGNTFLDLWFDQDQNGYMVSTKNHMLFNASANVPGMVSVPECTVLKWDGKQWAEIGAFDNSYYPSLGDFSITSHAFDSKRNLYVGGNFKRVTVDSQTITTGGVVKWDGKKWIPLGDAIYLGDSNSDYVSDLAVDSTDHLYVTGYFGYAGGKKCYGFSVYSESDFSIPLGLFNSHPLVKMRQGMRPGYATKAGLILRTDESGGEPSMYRVNGRQVFPAKRIPNQPMR